MITYYILKSVHTFCILFVNVTHLSRETTFIYGTRIFIIRRYWILIRDRLKSQSKHFKIFFFFVGSSLSLFYITKLHRVQRVFCANLVLRRRGHRLEFIFYNPMSTKIRISESKWHYLFHWVAIVELFSSLRYPVYTYTYIINGPINYSNYSNYKSYRGECRKRYIGDQYYFI